MASNEHHEEVDFSHDSHSQAPSTAPNICIRKSRSVKRVCDEKALSSSNNISDFFKRQKNACYTDSDGTATASDYIDNTDIDLMNENLRPTSEIPCSDLPLCTSEWTEETIFNRLELEIQSSLTPIRVFSSGYLSLITDEKERDCIVEHFHSYSPETQAKYDCLLFALKEAIDINCEKLSDISVSDAIKLNLKFKKPFLESCFYKWLDVYLIGKTSELRDVIRERCQKIHLRLQMFSDQLLYMVQKMNRQKPLELPKGMFQALFSAFVRIYDLSVFEVPNLEGFTLKIGENDVKSVPDAVICKPAVDSIDIEDKVIAVIEVKKEYSQDQDIHSEKTIHLSKKTDTFVEYVNSKLKVQHIGQMITALPSSIFGTKGIYGIIVQGTKVTFASLVSEDGFFENITSGRSAKTGVVVKYSKECNILQKVGRENLIGTFAGIETLSELIS